MRVMKKIQTLTLFSRNFQAPGTGFVVVGALAVPLFVCCCCGLFAILCPTLLQPHGLWPSRLLCPWNFPDKNTGMGCHFLLLGIFPTQGLNPSLMCPALAGRFFSTSTTWETIVPLTIDNEDPKEHFLRTKVNSLIVIFQS